MPSDAFYDEDLDRRLIALAKRAFRVAKRLPRDAFIEHIALVMGCTTRHAAAHLAELEDARYVLVRGTGTSAVVYPTTMIDTDQLEARGISVEY